MLKSLKGWFSSDISIDLGTANTLIYMKSKGIVLNEPSVVAIKETGNVKIVVAVGSNAKKMLGKTPASIKAIRPMKDGVIADFSITEKMLQYFIRNIHKNHIFHPSPRVLICVPCKATQVERKAIKESALGAGARQVYLIEEPLAAAIGAGLPIDKPAGSMVLDIGGGTTEIAIITMGGSVYSESVRIGGDKFDEALISYVRHKFGILIGDSTAERIKEQIGSAFPNDNDKGEMEVRGKHVADGVPRGFIIRSDQVFEAISVPLASIIQSLKTALEQSPPELAADISETGIVLTGGGAQLSGIDKLITEETGLKVIIADDPITCVVRGGGMALDLFDKGVDLQLLFSSE